MYLLVFLLSLFNIGLQAITPYICNYCGTKYLFVLNIPYFSWWITKHGLLEIPVTMLPNARKANILKILMMPGRIRCELTRKVGEWAIAKFRSYLNGVRDELFPEQLSTWYVINQLVKFIMNITTGAIPSSISTSTTLQLNKPNKTPLDTYKELESVRDSNIHQTLNLRII